MPAPTKDLIDFVSEFAAGVNMGIAPVSLQKNQLGNAVNVSLRGDFIRPRPPYQTCPALFNKQQTIQSAVQNGYFQGGCYYKPDSGDESLVCAIGGRMFLWTPTNPGDFNYPSVAVTEITPTNDPNPAAEQQAWLWQAENYVIWNDGVSVPVFYNGTSSRRSAQFPPVLYTVTTPAAAPGGVGETVELQLSAPYTQGAGYQVYISDGTDVDQYTLSPLTGAQLVLTNINASAGKTIQGGTNVSKNGYVGTVFSNTLQQQGQASPPSSPTIYNITMTTVPAGAAVNGLLVINGFVWQINSIAGTTLTIQATNFGLYGNSVPAVGTLNNGNAVYLAPNPQYPAAGVNGNVVSTTLASSAGSFVIPVQGQNVTVSLQSVYSGNVGDGIVIAGGQYVIQSINNNVNNTVLATFVDTLPSTSNPTPSLNPIPAGATVTYGVPGYELPPGRMGAYVMGRNWICLPDGYHFIASDLVGDPSGTAANQFRDAVLKVTENTYLVGGGAFSVPTQTGGITAIVGLSNLNTEINAGPVQVGTPTQNFSVNTPVDRATWASLTNPILAVSTTNGSKGQNGNAIANGDLLFRSNDGVRSLILTQTTFYTWGQVPISRELQPIFDADPQDLLNFVSQITFDNRELITATPTRTANGVTWAKVCAVNFDPVSSLRGKAPSIWEGYWQDLNVLQLVIGQFSGVQRAFAFVVDSNSLIQLVELLPFGNVTNPNITGPAPTFIVELPFVFKDSDRQYKRIIDGDLFLDQISGNVSVTVEYHADYDTVWHPWTEFSLASPPAYQPRLGFDEPPATFSDQNQRPYRDGYTFQIRLTITGWCRILGAKLYAEKQPEPQFAPQPPLFPPQ